MTGQPKSRTGKNRQVNYIKFIQVKEKNIYAKKRDDLVKIHTFLDIEFMLLD